MQKDLFDAVNEKYGPQVAESFVHFVSQDESLMRRLGKNFQKGLEFCLKILSIALPKKDMYDG